MRAALMQVGVILTVLFLFGCAGSPITQVSGDTYVISKSDHSPGFGHSSSLKSEVQADANEFATKQGKVAVPVSFHSSPAYPFHFASVDYRFRVLDKNDPAAIRAAEMPFPDDESRKAASTSNSKPAPENQNTYDSLIKLNDLKQKGIITQAEFDEQKKKILGGNSN